MKEKEISKDDYRWIYLQAVDMFIKDPLKQKETYEHFLTRCVIKGFVSWLGANKLEVRNGKIYEKKES